MTFKLKWTRLYYTMSREVFSNHPKNHLLYARDIFVMLYGLRLFFIYWAWEKNFNIDYINLLYYDPASAYFAKHSEQFSSVICIIMYLFGVFNFVCQTAYYRLNASTVTWRWWYELVVTNQDDFFECALDEIRLEKVYQEREEQIRIELKATYTFIPQFILESYAKFTAKWSIWFQLEGVDKYRLFQRKLQILPHLSDKLRIRVLLWLIVFDKACYILQIGLFLIFWSFYLFLFMSDNYLVKHPWYSLVWINIEAVAVLCVLFQMCRSAMFFTICTILGTVVYTGHVIEVGNAVKKLILDYDHRLPDRRIPLHQHQILYRQLSEHNLVCYLVVAGCDELFGNVLLCFLLIHLPINIYILQQNIFINLPFMTKATFWIICIFQAVAGTVVLAPLAWCCDIYHSPKRFIPKLQLMLQGKGWIYYKLKYEDLYNRLVRGPKMAVSIGPVEAITYQSALQFLFLYTAYILMAFGQMIEARANSVEK